MSRLEAVYARSPVWLQSAGIALYGLAWRQRRFGGVFPRRLEEFLNRDHYSADAWRQYQTGQMRRLLTHCIRSVPYYRRTWSAMGLTEAALNRFTLNDLQHLPLLEKEQIRRDPQAFLAENAPGRLHTYLTSGSTGTPLAVRMTAQTHQTWSAAYEARVRRWAGVDFRMSRAMLGGRPVVPQAASGPPFWRCNPVERQVYLSLYHLAPAHIPAYARALRHFRPDYMAGYASGLYTLARLIEEAGEAVPPLRAALTSSDALTGTMRRVIARVFRCAVFDAYSGVEACCLASECERHSLHVSPDVGIVELLDEAGNPVPPPESGEIVATGLLNAEQPLIRYRTGDLAAWSGEACPCGRAMPVLRELIGRVGDTLIGPDGRRLANGNRLFVGIEGLKEAQVVQEAPDRLTVRVVVSSDWTDGAARLIRERLQERLGPVRVEIEPVAAIERTERGKFRALLRRTPGPPDTDA